MIDHVSVPVADLDRSAAFYDAVLAPLGLARLVTRPASVGYGKRYPEFWINLRDDHRPSADSGAHVAIRTRDAPSVEAFHAAAIAHGATDGGAPGPRSAAITDYFGAFIIDPDGNKIEALTFPQPPST